MYIHSLSCSRVKIVLPGVNSAISRGLKVSKQTSLSGSLRSEVEYWHFLDSLEGSARWRTERHEQAVVFSNLSLYKYGGRVDYEGEVIEISNFWDGYRC